MNIERTDATKLLSTRMPAGDAERFAEIAFRSDRSVSSELRRAVREHLERNSAETPVGASEVRRAVHAHVEREQARNETAA
jgi:hypothetical protein